MAFQETELYKLHMRLKALENKVIPADLEPDQSVFQNAALATLRYVPDAPVQPASNIPPLVPPPINAPTQQPLPVPPHVATVPTIPVAPVLSPAVPAPNPVVPVPSHPVVAPVVPVPNPAPFPQKEVI